MFIVDFCLNLDSGAHISGCRQCIAKLKQRIGMIGEAYYNYVTKIRLYSAERAGGWGKAFRHRYICINDTGMDEDTVFMNSKKFKIKNVNNQRMTVIEER
jgi:hypothetical protein